MHLNCLDLSTEFLGCVWVYLRTRIWPNVSIEFIIKWDRNLELDFLILLCFDFRLSRTRDVKRSFHRYRIWNFGTRYGTMDLISWTIELNSDWNHARIHIYCYMDYSSLLIGCIIKWKYNLKIRLINWLLYGFVQRCVIPLVQRCVIPLIKEMCNSSLFFLSA